MTLRGRKLTFVTKYGRARVSKVRVYELPGDNFVTKESLTLKMLAFRGIEGDLFSDARFAR